MAKLWSSWEQSWNSNCHQLHYLLRSDYQCVDVEIVFSPMIIIEDWVGLRSPKLLVCKVDNVKVDCTSIR